MMETSRYLWFSWEGTVIRGRRGAKLRGTTQRPSMSSTAVGGGQSRRKEQEGKSRGRDWFLPGVKINVRPQKKACKKNIYPKKDRKKKPPKFVEVFER